MTRLADCKQEEDKKVLIMGSPLLTVLIIISFPTSSSQPPAASHPALVTTLIIPGRDSSNSPFMFLLYIYDLFLTIDPNDALGTNFPRISWMLSPVSPRVCTDRSSNNRPGSAGKRGWGKFVDDLWPLASDPVHLQTVREGAEREPVGAAEEPQQGGLHRGLPPGCDHTIFIENYVRKEKENVECLGVIWKCGWYSKLDNWDQFLSGGAWWAAWHSLLPGLYREEPWQDVLLGLISTHTK